MGTLTWHSSACEDVVNLAVLTELEDAVARARKLACPLVLRRVEGCVELHPFVQMKCEAIRQIGVRGGSVGVQRDIQAAGRAPTG